MITWSVGDHFEVQKTAPPTNINSFQTNTHTFHLQGQGQIATITRHLSGEIPPPTSTTEGGLAEGVRFYHTDHLDSSSVITNELGSIFTEFL